MLDFNTLAESRSLLPEVDLTASDLAQIVYTSGTEALPKGAMLTHDSVIQQYVSCIVDGEMSCEDLVLHSLPLYHCAQLDCFLGPGIYLGASNVITGKPVPDNLLPLIQEHKISSFFEIGICIRNHSAKFEHAETPTTQTDHFSMIEYTTTITKFYAKGNDQKYRHQDYYAN